MLTVLAVLATPATPARGERARPAARPLLPLALRFGNGCQTRTVCAAMERLGLYAGLSLGGTLREGVAGSERAGGGTLSLGFDFIRRLAVEEMAPGFVRQWMAKAL